MKTNLFSKIKTFFHNQIAKIIPLMTNENSTTDSHGWTRIWNQEFLKTLRKGIVQGFGIMLGMFGTGVMAVAVTGTIKTWSSNDKLTANDLNNTITSLKTAIEGIPNWNKNGTSAYYTDGNVGIGTSSPNQIFHVKSTGSMISNFETTNPNSLNYHNFIGSDGDAKGVIGIENSTGSGAINSGSPYGLFMVSTRSNSLTLGTNSTARMTINSSGNIGIGTNSPGANLTVNKSSGTGNSFQVGESGNYTFYGYNNGSGHTYYYNAQMSMLNTNPITFWSTGNSTSVMVRHGTTGSSLSIDASGGVGIGTTTPSVSLHVVGNACTTGTGMTACASDRRLKQNIKPIENALDLILKVKPVHFTWNQLSEKEFGYKSGTQDIGVIAQEIEKIKPDWVKTVKSDYKMVKDSFTKWYTIKAIQELNEKVEKGNSSLGSRYVSLLDEQKLLKKDYNNLSLRLHSVIEENTDLKQKLSLDQAKIQSLEKQLTELKKENSEKLISLEERIKNMEGSRYAKK